ncbi:MAG: glycosyltransferase family 9 protein [Nitrospiraceae bacterium]|nr:glycosyltransferase family 9 protein [Nitrospiraceae bacterium]
MVCTRYNHPIIDMFGFEHVIILNRNPGIFDLLRVLRRLGKKSFASSLVLDHTRSGDFGILASRLLDAKTIISGFGTTVEGDIHTRDIFVDDGETDILTLAKVSIASPIVEVPDIRKEIHITCDETYVDFGDYIGVHIGGFGSVVYPVSRQYPGKSTFALITKLLNEGYKVVITGDKADARDFERFSEILKGHEGFVNLAGRIDVKALGCLMRSLRGYVTPDNGTLHLAQAVGCKRIYAILGPTAPLLVRGRNTNIIRLDLPCSPCLEFIDFPSGCVNPEGQVCMSKLEAEIIFREIKQTL